MTDEYDSMNAGISAADGPERSREKADVQAWMDRIKRTRKFDEEQRKEYARNRRYARGDSGFSVDANLAGTYIDIKESFLYAQDPDVDALPAPVTQPPSIEAVREAAEEIIANSPEVMNTGKQAFALAVSQGVPPEQAIVQGMMAGDQAVEEKIKAEHDKLMAAYSKRLRDAKTFGETAEIVCQRLWRDASLKRRGRRWVRSGLTIGLGVIKASWQERTAPSPETVQAINDLQDNIKRAQYQRACLEEESPGIFERMKQGVQTFMGTDIESKLADYERQLATLRAQPEPVIARGFVADVVQGEDFVVPAGFAMADHADAPWNAHRIPMLASEAQAQFGLSPEDMKQATHYKARAPEPVRTESAATATNIDATDADAYVTSEISSGKAEEGDGLWIMVWEIWDRESSTVLTGIEGIKRWVKPAWTPKATTRFYPFFLIALSEIDGERHPQSLITRSYKLLDEYSRLMAALAEHRKRIKPKTIFNRGSMEAADVEKIEKGVTQEMVGILPTNPKMDLRGAFVPVTYAAIDPALYDTQQIISELERIWGIQEALSGSIDTQKTATEAEIQQTGFKARSSGQRELLESALQDLAQYTLEVAHANLSAEDVAQIAGPNSLWPPYEGPESLNALLSIEIRAGSSGKPNTAAERQSWGTLLPMLQQGISMIGQLRQSSPVDVADCYEQLLRITADRSGERLDVDSLIPKAGPMPQLPPGITPPGAPPMEPGAQAAGPMPAPPDNPAAAAA